MFRPTWECHLPSLFTEYTTLKCGFRVCFWSMVLLFLPEGRFGVSLITREVHNVPTRHIIILRFIDVDFFSDSKTTLAWCESLRARFTPFVAIRVGEKTRQDESATSCPRRRRLQSRIDSRVSLTSHRKMSDD